MSNDKLGSFDFEGQTLKVNFIESMKVTTGVACDVYGFEGDKSKDLAIVEVEPDCKTPLQRVLKGEKTIEGYISGKGILTITKPTGEKKIYKVGDSKDPFSVSVAIGELMQWQSSLYSMKSAAHHIKRVVFKTYLSNSKSIVVSLPAYKERRMIKVDEASCS